MPLSWIFLFLACLAWFPFAASAAPASQESTLKNLVNDLTTLQKDTVKGALRQSWQALIQNFDALHKNASGDTQAQSAYYAARSRESLAQRSSSTWDQTDAVARYTRFAEGNTTHRLAPEALYRAASIAGLQLRDVPAANVLLNQLEKHYAGSPQSKKSASLRKKFLPPETPTLEKTAPPKNVMPPAKELSAQNNSTPKQASGSKEKLVAQLGLSVKTIMIDAGHGGKDPGAEHNGLIEKDLTLTIAAILGNKLKKQGFTVVHTRTKDTFVALQDRAELANSKQVDLFISIHINANADSTISGLETYYLEAATSKAAAVVAARENSLSVDEISDLQFILTDLMLISKKQESRILAQMVHRGVLKKLRAEKYKAPDHGVRSAPFYVLMGARMPAILIELGYMTSKDDAANLQNSVYLGLQADGIVQGIINYRAKVEKAIP